MLGRLLGEHIEIVPRLDPMLPQLRADPTQLQQVLFNLALNARDAMPGGGTLTIDTQSVELGIDDVGALELTPGRYVVLTVADTGMGMSDDVRGRIFEPFFTTKGVGEGTGLGLPSVYGIVKQSRGDIEVSSRPLEGATFRIYLPAAGARTASFLEEPLGRVLLVEEAAVVRELVTTLLSEQGYDVVVADGPDDALRLAREEESFDILVTDLVLARTSGTHLAAQVQEHQPTVQVLYMSAYEPDERVAPEAVIPKPFSNEALLSKLDDLRASRPQR
jgi:two-component system, cell cycle sensor histidine kinase and response regulator CckA